MITAGIDVGAKTIKALLLKEGKVISKMIVPAGLDAKKAAEELFDSLLKDDDVNKDEVKAIYSTGAGRKEAAFADEGVTEVTADAKGTFHLYPSARAIIDVGAEEGRSIRCNENGKIIDFAVHFNDPVNQIGRVPVGKDALCLGIIPDGDLVTLAQDAGFGP